MQRGNKAKDAGLIKSLKIRNKKLAVLFVFLFCFLFSLGNWQLSRAKQKEQLLKTYQRRLQHEPLFVQQLQASQDLRFYRMRLSGYFDEQHTFLLDNKIYNKQVGYEVYTPFIPIHSKQFILVDRGFIPLTKNRQTPPQIKSLSGVQNITGLLNLPPTYVSFGSIVDSKNMGWPLRIEYVHLQQLSNLLGHTLFPYVLILDPNSQAAYPNKWEIVVMPPEKHRAYALQWFALALTLLILFVALNLKRE